jgi:HlyD family secretion protein
VSGTISKVLVDYNDKVAKNQVLAVLDQSSFKAAVAVSEASVEMREAELTKAKSEYDRYLPLFKAGHLSDEEFLTYKTSLKTAEASLQQAQAELKQNRINLDHTVIRSPIDGTVIERSVDVGQTVAASLSSPTLFIIAKDLSSMEIEVNVDENDIGMIRTGQKVRFTVPAYADDVFDGEVSTIRLNSQVVSNVVNYTVIVTVKDTKGILLPGMTATVDFIIERIENTLLVPSSAFRVSQAEAYGGSAETPGASDSRQVKSLLVIGPNGKPSLVRVPVLSDNGYMSAVKPGGKLEAGNMVVTSMSSTMGSSSERATGGLFSRLFHRPHGNRR